MPKPLSSRDVIRILRGDGWQPFAQKGSHQHFRHPTKPGKVTLPAGKKVIPTGTLRHIFRQAGLDWDDRP